MAGLGSTVARLLRQQSSWRDRFPAGMDQTPPPPVRGSGRLEETEPNGANPGNLRMFRYVPRGVRPNAPLVVVLHGCTQRAAAYADGAGWVELADRYGFGLLMPEQRRTNNPNLCFNWFVPGDTIRGAGEVESIHQMIAQTIADLGADPAGVFITGLSAGGAMTSAMLAAYPEVFAGGAIIAGLPYQSASDIPGAFQVMADAKTMPAIGWAELVRSASDHKGPWPRVSIWHGTDDQTVNPRNAPEIAKQWTELHGTGQTPDAVEEHESYTRRIWKDRRGEPAVEEYIVAGLGHGTPLATGSGENHFGEAAPFLLEAGLSSSHLILKFWGLAGEEPIATSAPAAETAIALGTPSPRISAEERSNAPASETPTGPGIPGPRIDLAAAPPKPAAAFDRREGDAPNRSSARHARYDIGAIINRALRSAGLMK